jgi:hypothetical protein
MRTITVAALLGVLCGCAAERIQPPYSEADLIAMCERHGGRWLPDSLAGGDCEYPGRL